MAAGLSVSVSGGGVYNTSHSITLTAIPSGNATGPFTYQWFNLYSSMPMNPNPAAWDLMPIGGGNSQTVSIAPYPGYYWYQVLVTSAPQHTGYWSDFRINLSQNISNSGIFTVRLDDMGQPNSQGISPAVLTCYVGGNAVGTYTLYPGQYTMCKSSPPVNFTSGTSVGEAAGIQLEVLNTTAGLSAYQKYAYISFVTPMVASAGTPLTVQNATNSTSNPYNYTFTGTWNGQRETLTWVPNHTVENMSDASVVGEITDFQTADPKYTCLNGETIYVWTAPSEYPGEYVVHNGDMGAQCTYLTLTFNEIASNSTTPNPYNYTFTGTWNGQRETLAWVPNHTIENMSDATLVGTISNFQTADPKYTCLNGKDINVWTAPSEYPGEYVVHNGYMGPQCTYLTLIFPESSNSIGFNVNIYPQIQVITLNESAMLLSTVNGGALPYTYQWYGQESGNSYSQIPGATYSDYLFTPYAHGVYNFELYATDATGKTVPSSPVEVVVVTEYTPVTINVTNENTELGISNTPHVILNLKKENSTVSVTHANNTAIDSTLSISNVTSSSPAAPPNTTKLLSLNVSTPASNISINFTMHYNCNVPSSKVSPYILNNGKWDKINNYTIDAAACTVTFHLNKDPVVALIENNSTSSSSTSPGSSSGAASGTGGVSSELSSTVVDLVAVVIVVAAVLIGLALVLGKKGKQQQTAGK